MGNSLPTLNYLTDSARFIDYRPTIDGSSSAVIFERTPIAGGGTTLQIIENGRCGRVSCALQHDLQPRWHRNSR